MGILVVDTPVYPIDGRMCHSVFVWEALLYWKPMFDHLRALVCPQFSKFVLQPVLLLVSDKRPVMRTAVFSLLDSWVAHSGGTHAGCLEKVLHALPEALANPNGRNELLEWAAGRVEEVRGGAGGQEGSLSPASLSSLAGTVVTCLLSKDSGSRASAQKLLGCV